MKNTISTKVKKQILKDINYGVFFSPEITTTKFYGEDDEIEVSIAVSSFCNLLDFQVIITDEVGNESYLCEEQLNELIEEMEAYLYETRIEALDEARNQLQ